VGVSLTPCSRRRLPPAAGLPTPALPPSLPAAPPAGTALPLPQPPAFHRQVHPFPPPARRAGLPSPPPPVRGLPPPASLPGVPAAAPAPSAPRRPPLFPAAGPPLRCRVVAPRRVAAEGRRPASCSSCGPPTFSARPSSRLPRATRRLVCAAGPAARGARAVPPSAGRCLSCSAAAQHLLPARPSVVPAASPSRRPRRNARSPCAPSCRAAVGRPGRGSSRVRAARSPLVRPASVSQWPSAPLASLRRLGSVPVPWRRPRHT
jgi:protein transport protein SEC31